MWHLPADTWPTVSATKLKIHEPKRKMHGQRENTTKLLEKCMLCSPRATPPAPLFLPVGKGDCHLKFT